MERRTMLRIKQLRLENNMSQRALATKIKSSQKAIDLWEKGVTDPKAEIVIALADAFECSADYLLGREDDFGNVSIVLEITENERKLLSAYAKLGKKEREFLFDYINYLLSKIKQ